MFFESNLLNRRGKFGLIWLAATRPIRLKRREWLTVNIRQQCSDLLDHILHRPIYFSGRNGANTEAERFSLYLSAQLMYGVVKVFAQQHVILLEDVQAAIVRVSVSYRHSKLDTPKKLSKAMRNLPNEDFVLERAPVDLEGDALLLPSQNLMLLGFGPGAHREFEVSTDARLTPPHSDCEGNKQSEANPLDAPLDEMALGGMEPVDQFDLLEMSRAMGESHESRLNNTIYSKSPVQADSAEFALHFGTALASPVQVPKPMHDIEPHLVNEKNEMLLVVPRVRPKSVKTIVDNVITLARRNGAKTKITEEEPYSPHTFSHLKKFPLLSNNILGVIGTELLADRIREVGIPFEDQFPIGEGNGNDENLRPSLSISMEAERLSKWNYSEAHSAQGSVQGSRYERRKKASDIKERSHSMNFANFVDPPPHEVFEPMEPLDTISAATFDSEYSVEQWITYSSRGDQVAFSGVCSMESTRRHAGVSFIRLLACAKKGIVSLRQDESYGEIFITKF